MSARKQGTVSILQKAAGGAKGVGLNAIQGAAAILAEKTAGGLVELVQKQLRDKDLWPTAAGLAYTALTVCDAVDVVFNCPPLTLDGMLHEVASRNCLPPLLQTQLQAHLSHPVSEREPRWCAMFRLIHENQVCSSLPKSYITRPPLVPLQPPPLQLLGAPRLGFAQ